MNIARNKLSFSFGPIQKLPNSGQCWKNGCFADNGTRCGQTASDRRMKRMLNTGMGGDDDRAIGFPGGPLF